MAQRDHERPCPDLVRPSSVFLDREPLATKAAQPEAQSGDQLDSNEVRRVPDRTKSRLLIADGKMFTIRAIEL